MKNKSSITLLVAATTLFGACNRAFLPKKSKVLQTQDGYLVDQNNQQLFIPMNVKQNFLSQINDKQAYEIHDDCDARGAMYVVGDTIVTNMHFNIDGKSKDTFSMQEKIYIARVRVTYVPFETNRRANKSGPIGFDYQGKPYQFMSYSFFEGDIYRINALDSAGNITGQAFD